MSTQVQFRRGTAAENNAFTGALAEVTVNTTDNTLRVHDGVTPGGATIVGLTATQTLTNKTLTSPVLVTPNIGVATGTSLSTTGAINTATTVSATGNITGGNINTGGIISSTGNIVTSGFFVGSFSSGTNLTLGNVTLGNIINVNSSGTGNIGNSTGYFNSGFFQNFTVGNTLNILSDAVVGGNLTVNGSITTVNSNTVTINDKFINVANNASSSTLANGGGLGVGPVNSEYATLTYNSTANTWNSNLLFAAPNFSATGNVTAANVNITGTAQIGFGVFIVSGNIQTTTANNTSNIGNASNYFNTVHAKATTAQYADVAELYTADAPYAPGTVLIFGGDQEVTAHMHSHSTAVAGVVSENPSHLMNAGLTGDHVVAVALLGRVPCQVQGTIRKGELLVASDTAGVAQRLNPALYQPGCIIGKSLENYDSTTVGMIEVAVGVK